MFKEALFLASMSVALALSSAALARTVSPMSGLSAKSADRNCWISRMGAVQEASMRTKKGARDGEFLTISYFAREGHPFPLPDAANP